MVLKNIADSSVIACHEIINAMDSASTDLTNNIPIISRVLF